MNCKFCNAELAEGMTLCEACGKDNAEEIVAEEMTEEIAAEISEEELAQAAEEAGEVGRISAYHLSDREVLSIDYAGRFEVRMPYDADYDYMLAYLEIVMGQLSSNETGIIDLTVPGEAHVITE